MSVDTSRLNDLGRQMYTSVDAALRAEVGRSLTGPWDAELCQRAALIAVQAAADLLRQTRDEMVEKQLADGPREAVAEALFDAAHEHCEDECRGGGRPWYDAPAKRLTDPFSAVSAFAVEQEIIRNDLDGDPAKDVGEDGWFPTLKACLAAVGGADETSPEDLTRELISLGAWAAEWVDHLARTERTSLQTTSDQTPMEG